MIDTGTPSHTVRERISIARHILLAALTAAVAGCGSGSPTAGTFSAETTVQQLVSGQKQEVELTVHYRLSSNPARATGVSYKAQLTAPEGWAVDPDSWEYSQSLKTTDIGFNETRKVLITVPADAAHGDQLVKLTISAVSESPVPLDLRFRVVGKDN